MFGDQKSEMSNEEYCWKHHGPGLGGRTCQHIDCRKILYSEYAGAAMEAIGQQICRQTGKHIEAIFKASSADACKVLQNLTFSQIMAHNLSQDDSEYKARLIGEMSVRWPAFQIDLRAGRI